jgi:hypothetical protein
VNGSLIAIIGELPLETHPDRLIKFTKCSENDWTEEIFDSDLLVPRCANLVSIAHEGSVFIIGNVGGRISIGEHNNCDGGIRYDDNCAEWQKLIADGKTYQDTPVEQITAGMIGGKIYIFNFNIEEFRVVNPTDRKIELKLSNRGFVFKRSNGLANIGNLLFGVCQKRRKDGDYAEFLMRFKPADNSWEPLYQLHDYDQHKPLPNRNSTCIAEFNGKMCVISSESLSDVCQSTPQQLRHVILEEIDADGCHSRVSYLPENCLCARLAFIA